MDRHLFDCRVNKITNKITRGTQPGLFAPASEQWWIRAALDVAVFEKFAVLAA